MRVYEVAKLYGLTTKDFMALLKKKGVAVSSHMVVATDEVVAVAKSFTKKEEKKELEASPAKSARKEGGEKKKEPRSSLGDNSVSGVSTQSSSTTEGAGLHKQRVAEDEKSDLLKYEINSQMGDSRAGLPVKGAEKLVSRKGGRGSGRSQARRGGKRGRRQKAGVEVVVPEVVTSIVVEKDLPLSLTAELLGKGVGEVIFALLKKGVVCNRNNAVSADLIEQLAKDFNIEVERPGADEHQGGSQSKLVARSAVATSSTTRPRWPVVVVMGHVDHGKTTFLDYVRNMSVAASEKGGITQHLGAYEVDSSHGKIVFLDTPGHEAFSYIRQRGTRVTDIVVLIVAADDGVKPQTVEAIKYAQQAEVPIVVAINKIDKVSSPAALEGVKRQLAQHGLMAEDWGGDVVCVPISAKTGKGVDDLLEMLVLQSQLMELCEEPGAAAKAFVLESHQERGLGAVATVLCMSGKLSVGDYFVCGDASGKVRLLIDSHGKRVKRVGVSTPVRVVGFDSFVSIGDWLEVVSRDGYLKAKANKGRLTGPLRQDSQLSSRPQVEIGAGSEKVINLVVKADTRGSLEALSSAIDMLVKKHKKIGCPINILSSGIGDIVESDIEFAFDTGAELIGLHVKAEKNAITLAGEKNKQFYLYAIIYQAIDTLEKLLLSKREAVKSWNKVGKAVVRKVFNIKGLGVIAGCYMQEGVISRPCKVECVRDGVVLGDSKITSLQREKKHVKEVHAGFECGFIAESFHDWQEGDSVVCYIEVVQEPT